MKMTNVHVVYTDGTEEDHVDLTAARQGILETITGCDFAINVQEITAEREDGEKFDLFCQWSIDLKVQVGRANLLPAWFLHDESIIPSQDADVDRSKVETLLLETEME